MGGEGFAHLIYDRQISQVLVNHLYGENFFLSNSSVSDNSEQLSKKFDFYFLLKDGAVFGNLRQQRHLLTAKISAQNPSPLKPKSSPHAQTSSYGENVLLAGPGKVIGHFWSKNHENDFREVA